MRRVRCGPTSACTGRPASRPATESQPRWASMATSESDLIWNRACLESGGSKPREGDRHLAAALLAHGLVANGGLHHAVESMSESEARAAISGFEYLGLAAAAQLIAELAPHAEEFRRVEYTDQEEESANARYIQAVDGDRALEAAFFRALSSKPGDFYRPTDVA